MQLLARKIQLFFLILTFNCRKYYSLFVSLDINHVTFVANLTSPSNETQARPFEFSQAKQNNTAEKNPLTTTMLDCVVRSSSETANRARIHAPRAAQRLALSSEPIFSNFVDRCLTQSARLVGSFVCVVVSALARISSLRNVASDSRLYVSSVQIALTGSVAGQWFVGVRGVGVVSQSSSNDTGGGE